MNMPLVLLNRRRRGGPAAFSPTRLFALAEPGVWYDPSDLTTLFQDTAGTTPVTTPGQTVALALDKSKGLVLGPELVTNGTFDANVTGWTATAGSLAWDGVNQRAALTVTAQDQGIQQSVTTTAGKFYRCTVTITNGGAGNRQFCIELSAFSQAAQITLAPGATQTLTVLLAGGGTIVRVRNSNAGPLSGEVYGYDNISVKELSGFHATQATLASRPTYGIVPLGGRRNLLERTEEFDNAYWSKTAGSVTANAGMAPNGTTTADKFIPNTSAVGHTVDRLVSSIFSAGGSVTFSCMVKADPYAFVGIKLYNQAYTGEIRATFNLTTLSSSTATLGTAPTGIVATITDAGNGWRALRVSCTFATGTNVSSSIDVNPTNSVVYGAGTAGDGTSGILIWGAQLETGSSATAYQRVGSAFDVTEAGVASLSYLSFDGVDDFMVTPTITPGTDKAQVFAGVRMLGGGSTNSVIELSASIASNSGSLALFLPDGGVRRAWLNGGGTLVSASVAVTTPLTEVSSAIYDIAGTPEISLRANAVSVATASGGATGNFLAYPLYIGRRGGTTLGFNGNIFSLIVRFGTNLDAGTITSTETWVGGKTGIDIAKWISPTIFARDETAILDRFNATIERRAV